MAELHGTGIGTGSAAGPVVHRGEPLPGPATGTSTRAPREELATLRSAMDLVATDLRLRGEQAGGDARDILDAQAMMAEDPAVDASATAMIDAGATAARAAFDAYGQFRERLAATGGYLAARVADLDDVRQRVVAACLGVHVPGVPASGEPYVLVARDLSPADTAGLDLSQVVALVTVEGGPTSHTAILARSRGIPAVVACAGAEALTGTVVVDAARGTVTASVRPTSPAAFSSPAVAPSAAAAVRTAAPAAFSSPTVAPSATAPPGTPAAFLGAPTAASTPTASTPATATPSPTATSGTPAAVPGAPTAAPGAPAATRGGAVAGAGAGRTADGRPVALLANIGSPAEAADAAAAGAEGVGLFRTEFLFLDAQSAPDSATQERAYREVLDAFAGRTVVARVLDAGADKPLAFLPGSDEPNPALGIRGIRALRARPDVLDAQLSALAAAGAPWVMAPMVTDADDAAWFVDRARAHGLAKAGVMIEVPSAALTAGALLATVDFVSIGTNDLTQYVLAADRLLGSMAPLQDPWHPAVLRLVDYVGREAAKAGKPVGVCGEAAADPLLACVLVGLGVTSLSMAPSAIAPVRAALAARTHADCTRMARAALTAGTAADARRRATA